MIFFQYFKKVKQKKFFHCEEVRFGVQQLFVTLVHKVNGHFTMPRKITIQRHFSSSILMKVMNEFQMHPISAPYWIPIDPTSLDRAKQNIVAVKDVIDLSIVRQHLYDGEYTTLDAWYNDCLSVFNDYDLLFGDDPVQKLVNNYSKKLFHKISVQQGVDLIDHWSEQIYNLRTKLNTLINSVPTKYISKNTMKTRKPKSKGTDKIEKIKEIRKAIETFKTPQDWRPSLIILIKNGYEVGKKKVDLDLMDMKAETINQLYNDLKERNILIDDDD
ncbi:hypothetical protein TRFO_10652 [Tritrichomonas foetus]|uniref:Bromo domain-containing protein n=1 Tax=Tritrichomonas foetus TaxID=1144522 RepID=A0A1J4J7F3_9EUKA|nr:hypothetical protein TRFO_10652 [Tritrichomonas foetus]|eukprot:OHS95166.1 hypothetical protein TRFO_10652 [Tritrichomonas foetus]